MNNKSLKTLEFDKIKQDIKNLAHSEMAYKIIDELEPSHNLATINQGLQETTDASTLIAKFSTFSFDGLKDINLILKRLSIGGNLSTSELLRIASQLRVASNAKSFANKSKDTINQLEIANYFYTLDSLSDLSKEINKCIISEDEIADDASDKLYHIRKTIKQTHDKIRQQLNKVIQSSSNQTMLQDAIITVKNNRFCVPVKAEHRGNFKGMIHEHSASGSTLFIEPSSVVELNNTLRTQINEEEKEIERILAYLSALANEYIEELKQNQDILSHLDFVFAKGNYSVRNRCSKPLFNENNYIYLKKARHPLLDSNIVVPIDIELGQSFTTLVITGPNTGGKTVTLKTVGLLSIMGQSGLHIPAYDGSSLTLLEEIYADIGDEQSIEQSLSTFSSHMTNIVDILKGATYNSLVLFDELGAGTDPTEGAALAMSILDNLFNKSILTIATTHYSELKVYALSTDGIENACQEFNVETLRPTYKLLIGIPGKSNAFAISKRLGLEDTIIDEAKEFMASKAIRFEDLITDLEYNKKTAILEKEKAEAYRKEAETFKDHLEMQKDQLAMQKNTILKSAKQEAYKILQEAKREADTIIKDMNSMNKKNAQRSDLEKNRSKLRSSMSNLESDLSEAFINEQTVDPSHVNKGDAVYVISFDQKGTVISEPNNKGDLQVQLGIMKTNVNISNIKLVKETQNNNKSKKKRRNGSATINKTLHISTEIDVRGSSSDEAIMIIDKYLDDAYLSHLPQITIIHGKGTGVLRQSIHKHLKTVKYVKSYRLGNFGEGESGVTIVDFK